jgi:hypothetical protein
MADETKVVLERLLADLDFRVRFEADRVSVLSEYRTLSPAQRNGLLTLSVDSFLASASKSQRANPATGASRKMV